MRKGKLLSGRSWRRLVRVLACITVFCTTYALILPAITQEVQAFCGSQEHKHTEECYEDILTCTKEEHVHDASCQDCQLEEHTHTEDCYRQLLKCGMEEHTHELECFSDPQADVETEADWKKTLPQDTEDLTTSEQIVATAESQEGYRESEKNYQVENGTETKGWTRYGSWDGDPYEDWTGAYVRFVLYYSQISTEDAKALTADWLEQLYKQGELETAENAEPGDVLFVYDETDELKAGIITKTTDTTITALMGDWKDKVAKEAFAIEDEDIHSIWKPVASERKEEKPEEPEPEPEKPAQEEAVQEAPKADSDKPEEQEAEKESAEVSYDYTQQAEAEDGAIIRASWNEGTFETEDVVFQARKVELSEEEQKKIQEHLDQDKDYTLRNYDLTFYVRGEDAELQEIEPNLPVHVEIEFPEEAESDDQLPVFHFKDNGELETVEKTKEKLESTKNESTRFKSQSFSTYVFPTSASDGESAQSNLPENRVNTYSDFKMGYKNILQSDIEFKEGNTARTYWFNGKSTTEIDMNGHSIYGAQGLFKVCDESTLHVYNSKSSSIVWGESGDNPTANATGHYLIYSDKNSTGTANNNYHKTRVYNLPLLNSGSGSTIEVIDNSTVTVSDVGIASWNDGTGISASGGSVSLTNTYVVQGKRGLDLSGGVQATITGGAVADHVGTDGGGLAEPGAGIKITDAATSLTLAGDVEIVRNISRNNNGQRDNGGGGINVSAGTLTVESAHITANSNYVERTEAGNVGWSTGGGIKGVKGAKIYLKQGAYITYNWADCSGGGISLSDEGTTLYMSGGEISNNTAQYNEGGGLSLQAQDSNQKIDGKAVAVLLAGRIVNNRTNTTTEWGGGGIFVGNTATLLMPNGADVTENSAYVYGGGIAGCSTGKIVVDDSVVVTNNSLDEKGERWTTGDKPFDKKFSESIGLSKEQAHDYFTCFYASVYGQFNGQGSDWSGNSDGQILEGVNDGWITSQYCMGLTSGNKTASGSHSLVISGNHSEMNGGGILVNGYAVGGSVQYIYNSDLVTVKGLKGMVDQSDLSKITAGLEGYRFVLKDGENEDAKVIGTGISDEYGAFVIPNTLVQTNSIESSTIDYYLTEVPESNQYIEYDPSVYRVSISVTTTAAKPITVTYPNPDYPDNSSDKEITVTIIEYTTTITGINIYKKEGASYQPYNNVSVVNRKLTDSELEEEMNHYIEGFSPRYLWTVNFIDSNGTFINKIQTKLDLVIKKEWSDDQSLHINDTVVLELSRYVMVGDNKQEDNSFKKTYTFTGQTWQASEENLPVADSAGREYHYVVSEVSSSNPLYSHGDVEISEPVLVENERSVPGEEKTVTLWKAMNSTGIWDPKSHNGTQVALISDGTPGYLVLPADSEYTTQTVPVTPTTIQDINGYSHTGYADIPDSAVFTARKVNDQGVFQANTAENKYLKYYHSATNDSWLNLSSEKDIDSSSHTYLKDNVFYVNPSNSPTGAFQSILCKNGKFQLNEGSVLRAYVPEEVTYKTLDKVEKSKTWTVTYTITNEKNPTYGFNVVKKSDLTGQPLSGAVFELRSESAEGAAISFVQDNGIYRFASGISNSTIELRSDTNGEIKVQDLPKGTYWLVETEAPEGYWQPTGTYAKEVEIKLGQSDSTEIPVFPVTNTPYMYELPETGSAGTRFITAAGSVFLLTATGLYGYNRKRKRKGGESS